MRQEQLNFSELFKIGLTPQALEYPGLAMLKNLRTNGTSLVACPTETVTKLAVAATPFTVSLVDYSVRSDGIYKGNTRIYTWTPSGSVKIANLVKFVMVQDSARTVFVTDSGASPVNPSGADIPLCNSLAALNGQVIAVGIKSSVVPHLATLDEGYVAWSGIGTDKFELNKENTSGSFHPNIGKALLGLPLQDSIIVLGSRGSCQMYYAGHTFGFRDLDLPRLKADNLGASSSNKAVYVAKDGSLVEVSKDGTGKNLGYAWIGSSTVDVKYFGGHDWFVFTTSDNSYILDSQGMFSFGHKIYGEYTESLVVPTAFEQASWSFRTTFLGFGRAGMKTLQEIYVNDGLSATNTRQVKAYSEDLLTATGSFYLNEMGASKCLIAGPTIAIEYTTASSLLKAISEMIVQFKYFERRFGNPTAGYRR